MRYLRRVLIVFSGTGLNFIFNYLLSFFLGRMLGPYNYGQYSVSLKLLIFGGIPSGVITTSIVRYSAKFKAKKQYGKLNALLVDFGKIYFLMNVFITILYVIFSNHLSNMVGGGIAVFVIIAALMFPIRSIINVMHRFFQGVGKIRSYAFFNPTLIFLKLIITIILLIFGYSVFGALTAIIISGLLVILINLPSIWPYINRKRANINHKQILKFGLPVVLTNLFIDLIFSFDLLFVSSLLGPEQAGYFEAGANLARALLITSAIIIVFFPEFSKNQALKNLKKLRSSIKWALFYSGILCIIGLIACWIFPEFFIKLTYSERFIQAAPIMRAVSLGYASFALFSVILHALRAINKHKIVGFFGAILFVIEIILLSFVVPLHGALGAAWVTTSMFIALFAFSLILVCSKIFNQNVTFK